MTLRCRRAIATALGVATLAVNEARCATDSMAVVLEYSAVTGCPEVGYFKGIVIERLGTEVFADTAPTHVIVLITSHGQNFEGNIEWLDARGNWTGDRTFPSHSSDCEDLVRAMAFTLALQIQLASVSASKSTNSPEAGNHPVAEATNPRRPAPASDKPVMDRPRPALPATTSPRNPRARPTLEVGAGASIGFGMSSSAVPFGRIFGRLAWPIASLELATEAGMPTIIHRSDGAGFSRQDLLASVAGCGVRRILSACLVAKVGEIRIAGRDIDVPASGAGPIIETGIRLKITERLYRSTYVSAFAEGLVFPIRWVITLDNDVVWRSPRIAEALGLEIAQHF